MTLRPAIFHVELGDRNASESWPRSDRFRKFCETTGAYRFREELAAENGGDALPVPLALGKRVMQRLAMVPDDCPGVDRSNGFDVVDCTGRSDRRNRFADDADASWSGAVGLDDQPVF
jgi:hypothetical protein